MADTKFLQKVFDLLNGVISAGAVNVNTSGSTTSIETPMSAVTIASGAGATHTGINTDGYNKFSLLFDTNKNCAVFIQDSDDDSNWYTLADKIWCDKIGYHLNGIASTVETLITPTTKTKEILIHNTDTVDDILLSLNSGLSFKTIPPNQSLALDVNVASFIIKGSAAGVTYETLSIIFSDYVNIKVNPDPAYSTTNVSMEFKSVRKFIRIIVYNLDSLEATVTAKLYMKV